MRVIQREVITLKSIRFVHYKERNTVHKKSPVVIHLFIDAHVWFGVLSLMQTHLPIQSNCLKNVNV